MACLTGQHAMVALRPDISGDSRQQSLFGRRPSVSRGRQAGITYIVCVEIVRVAERCRRTDNAQVSRSIIFRSSERGRHRHGGHSDRPETTGRIRGYRRFAGRPFGHCTAEAIIVALLRQRRAFDPELSLVAELAAHRRECARSSPDAPSIRTCPRSTSC